jgi:hypothetical protein
VTARFNALALAVALVAGLASIADAQSDSTADFWAHPVHATAFVGESFPTGRWRESFEAADDAGLTVGWPVSHGSGIWLEGQFNRQAQLMRQSFQAAFGARGGGASIVSLGLNVVVNAPDILFNRITPYVVGGGGGYSRNIELDGYAGNTTCSPFIGFCGVYGTTANRTRTQNVPGWDVGGGVRVRLKSLWVFAEARYNTALTRYAPTSFVPIVLGAGW